MLGATTRAHMIVESAQRAAVAPVRRADYRFVAPTTVPAAAPVGCFAAARGRPAPPWGRQPSRPIPTGGETVVSDAAAPDPFGVGLPLDTEVSRPRPGTVLLEVDGEIDTATAPRLQAGLDEALDAADAEGSRVVVDLTGVTFLASSGLAVLIGGARRVTALGGRLRLVAASRCRHPPVAGHGRGCTLRHVRRRGLGTRRGGEGGRPAPPRAKPPHRHRALLRPPGSRKMTSTYPRPPEGEQPACPTPNRSTACPP